MLLDSFIENKLAVVDHYGVPRFNKRVLYYIYKITYLQNNKCFKVKNSKQLEFEFYNN